MGRMRVRIDRCGLAGLPAMALLLFAVCSCATARASLGNLEIPVGSSSERFDVGDGRFWSGAFEAALSIDGCLHAAYGLDEVMLLCPAPTEQPAEGKREHWRGVGGDFVTELSTDGTTLRVSGYLARSAVDAPLARRGSRGGVVRSQPLRTPVQDRARLDRSLALGEGKQWDEMRRHPALLVVAAAVAGVRTDAVPPSGQAP